MEKVLKYPLSPVLWSLSLPDGLHLKTNKATLLHKLENTFNCFESQDFSRQPNTANIVDGNALLHCLSSDPDTFGVLAKQVFRSLPQTSSVHFVTDTYKPDYIKICERLRRGATTAKSYVLQGSATKIPKNFKEFLSNDGNKKASFDEQRTSLSTKKCVNFLQAIKGQLTPSPCQICSSHEEADSRIILHCILLCFTAANDRESHCEVTRFRCIPLAFIIL
ncbi:hypothetical protein PoB_001517400 [Plakobranchus ocellatus]|uniref:Uncharacterized protein n=1 Tax=Plakobranchus ocellatus TaxID=259542 RepID=A0AAV3Z2Q9_9GAST|nr:hypothetical protein PoB_001517400 [Plakobranchus ocellatus]